MKRKSLVFLAAVLGCAVGVLLCFVIGRANRPDGERPQECMIGEVGVTNDMLTDLALRTAGYFRDADYQSLSKLVHPEFGLIFSPSATVNLSTNLCFFPRETAGFGDSTEKFTWGILPDSGEPILMTVGDYLKNYVMDRDYTNAPIITVNYTARVGNARENITEIFPGADFVDLCYPGTEDANFEDWSILRLVFERYEDSLMLTAVIHSESTI